jgi:hypothetical protein
MLAPDVVEFLHSSGGQLATRDAQNRPNATDAFCVAVEDGMLTLLVPAYLARTLGTNLTHCEQVAFTVSRIYGDHRSIQLKGPCVRIEQPVLRETEVAAFLGRTLAGLEQLGVPPHVIEALHAVSAEPVWALSVRVEQLFDQTPGPKAGQKLGKAS